MTSVAIVKHFDVINDVSPGVLSGHVVCKKGPLSLQTTEKALCHGIMKKYGVQHQSWGPFAEGRKDMFTHSSIKAIGDKYGKSVAQVILRFLIQSDVVVG